MKHLTENGTNHIQARATRLCSSHRRRCLVASKSLGHVSLRFIITIKSSIPSAPRNMLGPSTLDAFNCVKAVDGETVSNETRSLSISTGARKAKSDSRMAVRERIGAK